MNESEFLHNVKVMASLPEGEDVDTGVESQNQGKASPTERLAGIAMHDLLASLNSVYDAMNHPTFALDFSWWLSKTGNPLCLWSAACYLVYRPEIRSARSESSLSWSELESHCHRLAQTLRNHATDDLVAAVRTLLENSPYQALLEIAPTSHHTDTYIAGLKSSLRAFQHYATGGKVHIPCHPTAHSGMDIQWGQGVPLTSTPVRGPSGSMTNPAIAGVDLGWVGISYSMANVQEHATQLAGAGVETGMESHTTGDVADKAASGGCVSRLVSLSLFSDEASEYGLYPDPNYHPEDSYVLIPFLALLWSGPTHFRSLDQSTKVPVRWIPQRIYDNPQVNRLLQKLAEKLLEIYPDSPLLRSELKLLPWADNSLPKHLPLPVSLPHFVGLVQRILSFDSSDLIVEDTSLAVAAHKLWQQTLRPTLNMSSGAAAYEYDKLRKIELEDGDSFFWANVKVMASPLAGASVETGGDA
jgi:hypothetical protein